MDFYEELFDDWLTKFIELKLRSDIRKSLKLSIKKGITDLRILYRDLDKMLIDFFENEFYSDKIVEVDKPVKRKVA